MSYRALCAIFFCMSAHNCSQLLSMDESRFLTLNSKKMDALKKKYQMHSLGRKQATTSPTPHAATIFNQPLPLTPQQATYKLMQTVQELRGSKEISTKQNTKISTLLQANANAYQIMNSHKDINDTIAHKILEHVISSGNLQLLTECLNHGVNFKKKMPQAIDAPYEMVLKVCKMDEVKAFKHAQTVLDLIDEHEKKEFSAQGIGSEIN